MSRIRVKFCGIVRPGDAALAAACGADAVGFVLHADAKRKIDPATARAHVRSLPPYVTPVGLFVDAPVERIRAIAAEVGVRTLQLHGDETPTDVAALTDFAVVKAVPVDAAMIHRTLYTWRRYVAAGGSNLTGILLDTAAHGAAGGTGIANDFALIRRLRDDGALDGLPPIILAGGLTPETVGAVVRDLRPYAVDTSSGIEIACGEKSEARMRAFATAVAEASGV